MTIRPCAQKTFLSLALLLTSLLFPAIAKADDAVILKYSGGRLVYAGVAENVQFMTDQGFLNVGSDAYGFRDKCTGQVVRIVNDFVIKQSRDPVNCNDLPKPQGQ